MQFTPKLPPVTSTHLNSPTFQPGEINRVELWEFDRLHREIKSNSDRQTDALNRAASKISEALSAQSHRDWESMQRTNRTITAVAGLFGGLGILAIFSISILQTRSLNRMAAMMGALHHQRTVPRIFDGYTMGEAELAFNEPTSPGTSNQRYLQSSIKALEQRFNDFQESLNQDQLDSTRPPLMDEIQDTPPSEPSEEHPSIPVPNQDQHAALIGKGETLLKLKDYQAALQCFQLALDQQETDAPTLFKRAKTLEHLNRLDEAIASYDKALESDQTLTMAYLGKAGIFNRLERFDDALACYEQALTPRKPA